MPREVGRRRSTDRILEGLAAGIGGSPPLGDCRRRGVARRAEGGPTAPRRRRARNVRQAAILSAGTWVWQFFGQTRAQAPQPTQAPA